jgi:hypothetical protein
MRQFHGRQMNMCRIDLPGVRSRPTCRFQGFHSRLCVPERFVQVLRVPHVVQVCVLSLNAVQNYGLCAVLSTYTTGAVASMNGTRWP